MTWLKLDDSFPDHPKIVGLPDRAFRLYVRGLCYSAHYLTDGWLPEDVVASWIVTRRGASRVGSVALKCLEERTLWHRRPHGWRIHAYLKWNPSSTEVAARKAADLRRKKSVRSDSYRTPPQVSERNPITRSHPIQSHPIPHGVGVDLEPHTPLAVGIDLSPQAAFIDEHQEGLLQKLWAEQPEWASGRGSLTRPGLVKLMKSYGAGPVNTALEDLVGCSWEVDRPYPFLKDLAAEYAKQDEP